MVFEKAERPMHVFCPDGEGNPRRYVHPSVENWPFYGGDGTQTARLPVMRWQAGTPKNIACMLADDIKDRNNISIHVNVVASIGHRGDIWKIDFASQRWSWNNWPKASRKETGRYTKEFDLLIFAIGFGNDKASPEAPGYWEDDRRLWSQICKQNNSKVLISGDGDGAIIDAVSAVVATEATLECHQQELVSIVLEEVPKNASLHDA
jgi:hypothetical protein